MSQEDPLLCCICYDEAGDQGFMEPNPCKCTGTIKIHHACYEQVRDEFGRCGACSTLFPKEIILRWQNGQIMQRFWAISFHGTLYKHGEYLEYKQNGVLRLRGQYHMDLLDGSLFIYNNTGNYESITQYLQGYKNGLETEFYPNGNLKSETEYVNGIQHGRQTKYFANKVVNTIAHYKNGQRHGPYISHYPNGQIDILSYYIQGKLHGQFVKHYSSGLLQKKVIYTHGNITSIINVDHE